MNPCRHSDRRGGALRLTLRAALAAWLALAALGCGGDEKQSSGSGPGKSIPYESLSDYGFFEEPLSPRAGVVPYEVASTLWADHAGKKRFIVLPKGGKITPGEVEDWQFPQGAIIIKTFFMANDQRDQAGAARVLETRLLILEKEGWTPHTYVWNKEQTDAKRVIVGAQLDVDYMDAAGAPAHEEYVVPNTNQCKFCHERDDTTHLLGVITPQLNRDVEVNGGKKNQLEWFAEQGMFDGGALDPGKLLAFPDPRGDAPLDARARAYLHANCSHCHRPGGEGGPSGLVLLGWEQEPIKNGICKTPVAAGSGTGGHSYDIVPGDPDASIIPFRMGSTDPEIKMPELPNRTPDADGIALIRSWITALPPAGCEAASPSP